VRKLRAWKTVRPLSREEKYGHVWAAIFLFLVLALVFTLVGRGCFLTP
jgi:hypothetical protein